MRISFPIAFWVATVALTIGCSHPQPPTMPQPSQQPPQPETVLPRTHRSSRLGRRNIDAHLLNRATGGAFINSDIARALLRGRTGTFQVRLFAASPAPSGHPSRDACS
jgi:hypothetical protein